MYDPGFVAKWLIYQRYFIAAILHDPELLLRLADPKTIHKYDICNYLYMYIYQAAYVIVLVYKYKWKN